jgi:hypothetical protein
MKYKVGDLIDNRWGNVDKLGYIVHVDNKQRFIIMVFFENTNIEVKHTFSGFERYYKVL